MSSEYESFSKAISEELPSGVDLEYDPEFARMEKAAKGTPDQAFGSTVIEAQPPEWDVVRDAAMQLLTRSKDLRVAANLALANLYLSGINDFRDALAVIDVFVNQFWESVFPQLDADDDDDPTIRLNSLMSLNDAGGIIRQLRVTPILRSRSVGMFSLLHVAVAKGDLPLPDDWEDMPTLKQIDAAVHSCDQQELQEAYQATQDCLQHIAAIEGAFSERLGFGTAPNFEALIKEFKSIAKQQKTWLDELRESQPLEQQAPAAEANGLTTVEGRAAVGEHPRGMPMAGGPLLISCREDVIDALDKIIRWLERYEPSSPLPMLLRRAKRLSNMSFLDILRDISPEAIDQALLVGGAQAAEDEYPSAKVAEKSPATGHESSQRSSVTTPTNDDY